MRYASVCSGIESPAVAWHGLGWDPVWFSENAPFPSAVLAHHYPNVPNLGDMNHILEDEKTKAIIDLLIGGTPCFGAGTLIQTNQGLKSIEDVHIGDMVLTHKGRWKKVLATGSKMANTICVSGQGSSGIITTPNHPFYVREMSREWDPLLKRNRRIFGKPMWKRASESPGSFWGIPDNAEKTSVNMPIRQGNEHGVPVFNERLMFVVGAYIGNGWTRISKRRSCVLIAMGKHVDCTNLEGSMDKAGLNYSKQSMRTAYRYQISNSSLAKWLKQEFGSGASKKSVPAWLIYGASRLFQTSFLDGYYFTDGCEYKNSKGQATGKTISTVSKKLSVSLKLLCACLGYSVSERMHIPPKTGIIEGRTVNQRPVYSVTYRRTSRSAFNSHGMLWLKCKKIKETGRYEEVWNIEVEEDNSYTADGITVHNCQSFSVAGLGKGLDDPRGNLTLVYLRILDKLRPRWFVWENVPNVLSNNKGRAFSSFLGGVAKLGYGWSYRILDAQYFGLAQRRKRVFVVGHYSGAWQYPAAVLFDAKGLSWSPPPSREEGEGTSRDIANCLRASGPGSKNVGDSRGANNIIAMPVYPILNAPGNSPGSVNQQDAQNGALMVYSSTQISSKENRSNPKPNDPACTLTAQANAPYLVERYRVRRITPIEGERLQGFPDDYTRIPWRGKEPQYCPDGHRYRAIGNAMATPVIKWLGERIKLVDPLTIQHTHGKRKRSTQKLPYRCNYRTDANFASDIDTGKSEHERL